MNFTEQPEQKLADPVLAAKLRAAVAAIEWLRERIEKRNPFRKRSEKWIDWESADQEQFAMAQDACDALKKLLKEIE